MTNLPELVSRLQEQLTSQMPDCAEAVMHLPSAVYTSEDRFQRERKALFRQLPLFVGFSAELPEPNSFRTMTIDSVRILLTRDKAGTLRAFRNSCRHRGMAVTEKSEGCAKRFTCPFHGWTFGNDGSLIGIAQAQHFPGVDKKDYGLSPIAVAEKYGLMFLQIEGDGPIDIDAHLGGLEKDLSEPGFQNWRLGGRNEHRANVNWKLFMDGFCEGYHFNTIHPNTLGAVVVPNTHVVDIFGLHARELFANKGLQEFTARGGGRPISMGGDVALIYLICPNLILIALHSGGWHAISIWPDGAIDRTLVSQTILVSDRATAEEQMDYIARANYIWEEVIKAEDFAVSESIWSALKGGDLPDMVLGRNEYPVQHFHRQFNRLAGPA
ncbi:aromatic ring-hydroxylating dioxygenase subunit alpha [Sphingobium sp. V4]|uniref:aromatic ring-hydroxylating oxygenase subunit alpha n=1 Tax=Sphingobium sp. V4 TaxID=3038927 RepID=UPI002557DB58|nr:aromatic ring-hydroxylating dioxygenase subunit alpha [Sphingobium sp. V4]WIW89503.1 aromatic ring-hydroxylating dioxygenase subunit alpha [Sphingobium sp. V4]